MSRRKAFNTGLSQPSSTSTSTSNKSLSSEAARVKSSPSIHPPDPSHATLHVPSSITDTGKADQSPPTVDDDDKDTKQGAVSGAGADLTPPEINDSETCFICAEPITFWSVGVCGHRTCHVCAVRLRVFYKKFECTYCKTICPTVFFSRSPTSPFPSGPMLPVSSQKAIKAAQEESEKPENKGKIWYKGLTLPGSLDLDMFPFHDEKMNIVFEDEEMMETTLLLLRYNCPYPDCPHMASNWSQLGKHTLAAHGLNLCRLCTSQLSRFAHEQVLYPPHLLGLHDPSRLQRNQRAPRPRGDEVELVKTWDAPHPLCEFCHEAFFGTDELFKHMREKHEECFVCRDQLGERNVYFQNYAKLEEHFKHDHFVCNQPACVEEKFVVFATELDLRAHLMEKHAEDMSARDRAQARQVNIDFGSQTTGESSRGNSSRHSHGAHPGSGRGFTLGTNNNDHGGRGRGIRGDDLQHQQIAPPPMNQAQAAQQRRQVQIDRQEESRRRKAFVTNLSENVSRGGTGSGTESGAGAGESGSWTPIEPSLSGFSTPREDLDDASVSRHGQLLARVAATVGDSTIKLTSFRSAVRGFKNNESAASDMIDTIFNILDQDVDSTVGIVKEVGNLLAEDGDREKSRILLEALNGWRVQQQEHFPSLGAAPTGTGTSWAGISSGRILNAKRSTNIKGRGSTFSRNVWDRVEAAAASHPVNRPTNSSSSNFNPTFHSPSPAGHQRYVPGAGMSSSLAAFPTLGSVSGSGSAVRSSGSSSTPWSVSTSNSGSGTSTKLVTIPSSSALPRSTPAPTVTSTSSSSSSRGGPNIKSNAAFPSLPTSNARAQAQAERQALFSKPTAREESLRRITGVKPSMNPGNTNGWGTSSVSDSVGSGVQGLSLEDSQEGGGGGGGGGKKKGKGKQLLFTVSARPS